MGDADDFKEWLDNVDNEIQRLKDNNAEHAEAISELEEKLARLEGENAIRDDPLLEFETFPGPLERWDGKPLDCRYRIGKIYLEQTCGACPEQYDAYREDGKYFGYFRLRHGFFTVDNANDDLVYSSRPEGDGCFETEERKLELCRGVQALLKDEKERNETAGH